MSIVRNGSRHGVAGSLADFARARLHAIAPYDRPKTYSWICSNCNAQRRSSSALSYISSRSSTVTRRSFSTSGVRRDADRTSAGPANIATPAQESTRTENTSATNSASLPSKTDERRWHMSKRMARMMDGVLARASIAGQHINVYTGTDYSGIEALRTEIIEQEQKVRKGHQTVDMARSTHREAFSRQGSAQKEIVSLLERKSSWSPTDLERYMSLVRSEHINEQAVQTAKDDLAAAERDLEIDRSLLERLERKQYHEEQIWSDTIRRNSTWVTFGLMGVNIILLLAQIGIFEPYRRRRIVREVKKALDEKTAAPAEVEQQLDGVIPTVVPIEAVKPPDTATPAPLTQASLDASAPAGQEADKAPLAAGEVLPEEAMQVSQVPLSATSSRPPPETWSETWEAYKEGFQDLFSERIVQLKRVDVTTTALQGAATGVAAMGLLFVVFRPR